MKEIIITNFTDPICVWCWATEPVFRALETHYPGQIEFRYITGGLVDNIDDFADPGNGIDAGSYGANKQIMSHWLESADQHGMPIKSEGFELFSKEYPSSYPQNISYKAAQIIDPQKADVYLRRLREATYTESKVTSRRDVQLELAKEIGLDIEEFTKAMDSGEAEKKFKADLAITYATGVSGFPSFLVKTQQARQVLVRGFKTFEDFKEVIGHLTDGSLKAAKVTPTFKGLTELMNKHPKLALEEVRQAFDFSTKEETEEWLMPFIIDDSLIKEEAGTSYFIKKPSQ